MQYFLLFLIPIFIFIINLLLKKYSLISNYLNIGKVIGFFSGRTEFGPRALGARSIIGDPRIAEMQTKINLKIKYRESFRPFAPAVLAEHVDNYFELKTPSPYMLFVAPILESRRIKMTEEQSKLFGIEKIKINRSELPSITHIDYSSRIQTVHEKTNPRFHALLTEFEKQTGCAVLVNTSFNVRGEPIVCSPEDAYRCFMRTKMDYLVLENIILDKRQQMNWTEDENWRDEFDLD
jgi:carbamoyltransferase